jgi:hypothetical protein
MGAEQVVHDAARMRKNKELSGASLVSPTTHVNVRGHRVTEQPAGVDARLVHKGHFEQRAAIIVWAPEQLRRVVAQRFEDLREQARGCGDVRSACVARRPLNRRQGQLVVQRDGHATLVTAPRVVDCALQHVALGVNQHTMIEPTKLESQAVHVRRIHDVYQRYNAGQPHIQHAQQAKSQFDTEHASLYNTTGHHNMTHKQTDPHDTRTGKRWNTI